MAEHYLRLERRISEYQGGVTQGIRIRVDVVDSNIGTLKIFRYLMEDVNPATGTQAGQFNGVCSPVDIADMPEDTPNLTDEPAWFRLAYVDLVVASRAVALELWDDLLQDFNSLCITYDSLDQFEPLEEFLVGTAPDSSSSSEGSA